MPPDGYRTLRRYPQVQYTPLLRLSNHVLTACTCQDETQAAEWLDGMSETCSQTARQTDSAKHRHSEPASA